MAKAMVKKNETVPAEYDDLGFEADDKIERHELSIPFYGILQSNSPEVEEETVPGAKSGMIINTVTKELFKEGIYALPVKRDYQFVEWVPRTQGGGFVGLHHPTSETVVEAIKANGGTTFGDLKVENNDLVETFFMYIMQYDPKEAVPIGFGMVSFAKTKIKPYKDWVTSMQLIVPPVKHRVTIGAHFTTIKQTNPKGTFYNFLIKPATDSWKKSLLERPKMDNVLKEAASFQKMISEGMVSANFESTQAEGSDGDAPF